MVDPASINLKSNFFNSNTKFPKETVPNFDCNVGLKMSDSEEDDENFENIPSTSSFAAKCLTSLKEKKQEADFSKHQKFTQKLEIAKEHLKNFKSNAFVGDDKTEVDISKLLEQGEIDKESNSKESRVTKSKKHIAESDESDWEEVCGNFILISYTVFE